MARILRTSFSRIQRFRASNCKYCETYECLVPGNISMLCFRFSLLGKNKNRSQKNSWGWISYWGSMWILFLETLLPNCNSAYPNCGHSSAGHLCLKYDSSIGWTSYSEIGLTSELSISIIFEMSLRMYVASLDQQHDSERDFENHWYRWFGCQANFWLRHSGNGTVIAQGEEPHGVINKPFLNN